MNLENQNNLHFGTDGVFVIIRIRYFPHINLVQTENGFTYRKKLKETFFHGTKRVVN